MSGRRKDRLNSLLKEVIADVIRHRVRNPDVHPLVTVSKVDVSKDIKYAKIYISVIASEEEKQKTLNALNSGSGFIAVQASKQVVLRFFPSLTFYLDNSVEQHFKIDKILSDIQLEREKRNEETPPENDLTINS
jgi:ribosome-binding factor A